MASAIAPRRSALIQSRRVHASFLPATGWPYWISGGAAIVAGLASALTLFVPGVLRGTAVMNGSGRGTAAVVLVVAVPALLTSVFAALRGSARALIVWLGAAAYLLYNAILFLFITPFNQLFFFYVAMFTLSFWALVTTLRAIDAKSYMSRFPGSFRARAFSSYLALIAVFNAAAWLVNVVPAVFSTSPAAFLAGTGLPTNPVYVQDLSFWIPLMLVTAVSLWRRRAWGFVLTGAFLVFGVIESVSIAVDQWMGSAADPSSAIASAAMAPIFAALALIELVPLFLYMRKLIQPRSFTP
ncbi:MAG TPA: hypothetical protein VF383_12255 [Candidatus Dormibacteraeota bacterium]